MLIRRIAVLGMAVLVSLLAASPAGASSFQPQGRAALLIDGNTGQILYQQNGQARNFPASTTKLLTALVAVEHGKLDQMVKVSTEAVDQPWDSSSCYLEANEEQRLDYLLHGLLLASGNDCAIAIAEGVTGGNSQQFMDWMNETARRVGAANSHFTNPHGLHEPDHYTTALDLALISRAALANPTVRKIAGTREFFWPGKSERNGIYYNHNQMLVAYEGTVGGKTGFTEEAGLTLVSAAERDGRYLVGIVMGEQWKSEQYNDMIALLDMGFSDFETQVLVKNGTTFGEVPVTEGTAQSVPVIITQDFKVSAPRGGKSRLVTQTKLDSTVAAPVEAGQKVGTLEVREGDRLLAALPLVAQAGVDKKPALAASVAGTALTVLKWAIGAFGSLLVFRTVVKTTRRVFRRSRRRNAGLRPANDRNRGTLNMYRTK